MAPAQPSASTEIVNFSYVAFVCWWVIIAGMHTVTCVYNAFYAYCYWKLQDSSFNSYLEMGQISMASPYHHTISIVFVLLSVVHGICTFLMITGSIYQHSLVFTPWSSSHAENSTWRIKDSTNRTDSLVLKNLSKAYDEISDRHGFCGVNGKYFDFILLAREIVELALQTVKAYRMSVQLSRTLLNRFYVVLLVMNCWSSSMIQSRWFKHDEARRRFACIAFDCILDLVSCMGVEVIVLLSYVGDFDPRTTNFPTTIWYNDEWVARAANEFKILFVVSWQDLVSRAVFSLGLVITTTNMKELLRYLPRSADQIINAAPSNGTKTHLAGTQLLLQKIKIAPSRDTSKHLPESTLQVEQKPKRNFVDKEDAILRDTKLHIHRTQLSLRIIHSLVGAWGVIVLGLHIHASVQPILPQCLIQVQPWAVSRPSCYLVGLDCHTLEISGKLDEVHEKWSEFDSSTVIHILIRHCPALELPDIFNEFHELHAIKIYNTTIKDWAKSAAITNSNHPGMLSLLIARVNMTNGLLPAGLQSDDFPQGLFDIEFCFTNLRTLPDDLGVKWPQNAIIYVEYSQLTSIPPSTIQLEPYYLSVAGNSITSIPFEIFENQNLVLLSISNTNIHELPRTVTQLSSNLVQVFLVETNISFFWSWADELVVNSKMETAPWVAGSSSYCLNLDRILNGSANGFSIPLLPEYSQTLMNATQENLQVIENAVDCNTTVGMLYPLDYEDAINAIGIPPPLQSFEAYTD